MVAMRNSLINMLNFVSMVSICLAKIETVSDNDTVEIPNAENNETNATASTGEGDADVVEWMTIHNQNLDIGVVFDNWINRTETDYHRIEQQQYDVRESFRQLAKWTKYYDIGLGDNDTRFAFYDCTDDVGSNFEQSIDDESFTSKFPWPNFSEAKISVTDCFASTVENLFNETVGDRLDADNAVLFVSTCDFEVDNPYRLAVNTLIQKAGLQAFVVVCTVSFDENDTEVNLPRMPRQKKYKAVRAYSSEQLYDTLTEFLPQVTVQVRNCSTQLSSTWSNGCGCMNKIYSVNQKPFPKRYAVECPKNETCQQCPTKPVRKVKGPENASTGFPAESRKKANEVTTRDSFALTVGLVSAGLVVVFVVVVVVGVIWMRKLNRRDAVEAELAAKMDEKAAIVASDNTQPNISLSPEESLQKSVQSKSVNPSLFDETSGLKGKSQKSVKSARSPSKSPVESKSFPASKSPLSSARK